MCDWLLSKLRIGSRERLILDKVGRHLPRSLAALHRNPGGGGAIRVGVQQPRSQQHTPAWMLINMCRSVALTSVEQAAETERWDHSSCWLQYSLRELFMCPAQRHASA